MKNVKLIAWIIFVLVVLVFAYSTWQAGLYVTVGAFLTLFIMSFLYKDNPYYKFAEHLFVGVSAGYWMVMGFWNTMVPNLAARLHPPIVKGVLPALAEQKPDYWFLIPLALGILLLMRLSPKGGWISRWALAFIVGTTAGLNLVRYLRSDFIKQVSNTMLPLAERPEQFTVQHQITIVLIFLIILILMVMLIRGQSSSRGLSSLSGGGLFLISLAACAAGAYFCLHYKLSLTGLLVFAGVFCGLVYFFFSKEHHGIFGGAARFGILVLMLTFGAGFGYTVMARISLLAGRMTYLFGDWLGFIK